MLNIGLIFPCEPNCSSELIMYKFVNSSELPKRSDIRGVFIHTGQPIR